MSLDNDTPRHVAPTHPGEMLREDFMPDFGRMLLHMFLAPARDIFGVERNNHN